MVCVCQLQSYTVVQCNFSLKDDSDLCLGQPPWSDLVNGASCKTNLLYVNPVPLELYSYLFCSCEEHMYSATAGSSVM